MKKKNKNPPALDPTEVAVVDLVAVAAEPVALDKKDADVVSVDIVGEVQPLWLLVSAVILPSPY